MADESKYLKAKQRIADGMRKLIAESEQLGRDIAWWNANRTDAQPFDRGGDLCAAHLAKEVLALVESDQRIPDELWARLQQQLRDNASN